jgi:site-specific recombinase XerD
VWINRLKNSLSVEQPIAGDELRAIKRYLAMRTDKLPWLFLSERGQPMTRQSVNYLISAAGESAGLRNVHPIAEGSRRHPLAFISFGFTEGDYRGRCRT